MSNTDTSNESVVTSYAKAQPRMITAGGVTCAYRELGPRGGIPVVFFMHLAATMDNWDPRIIDPIAKNRHVITFDQPGVPPRVRFRTASRPWQTMPTPSSRPSGSTRSMSSPSPSAA